MADARKAQLDADNNVINIIIVDSATTVWEGLQLQAIPNGTACDMRYRWDGSQFILKGE